MRWPLVVRGRFAGGDQGGGGPPGHAAAAPATPSCSSAIWAAGKTAFAQGFAAALGVEGPVTSPTFTLVRQYRCGPASPVELLIHADVYRTGSLGEVVDLALAELVEERAVALVEWGDMAAPALGDDVARGHPGPARSVVGPDRPRRARSPSRAAAGGRRGPTRWRGRCRRPRRGPREHRGHRDGHRDGRGGGADRGRRPGRFALAGRRRHVESLVPALEHLLDQVGTRSPAPSAPWRSTWAPGSSPGLRVGVATAKGLAQALGIGVVGLSSLDVLHRRSRGESRPRRSRALRGRRPTRRGLRRAP